MSTQNFINEISKYIKKYASKYGIKVISPIIAQAVLESESGKSELALNANNFFGIKYSKGRCPTSTGIYYKVGSEQNADGTYKSSNMQWCKFNNMEDCVIGYFDFINTKRYSNLKGITDPKLYLETIKNDGYATSLKYVNNVYNVIIKYNLTKYDSCKGNTAFTNVVDGKGAYYRVQCGAYRVYDNAVDLQNKLRRAGITNSVIKQIDSIYKVQIGAFNNKANAEKLKNDVVKKGFKAFISFS